MPRPPFRVRAEHLQEGLWTHDADAAVLVEVEQILTTGHEVVRCAFNCALEVAIICRVVADDVQRDLAWLMTPRELSSAMNSRILARGQ